MNPLQQASGYVGARGSSSAEDPIEVLFTCRLGCGASFSTEGSATVRYIRFSVVSRFLRSRKKFILLHLVTESLFHNLI